MVADNSKRELRRATPRPTGSTAFEAAQLSKPPVLRGVSDSTMTPAIGALVGIVHLVENELAVIIGGNESLQSCRFLRAILVNRDRGPSSSLRHRHLWSPLRPICWRPDSAMPSQRRIEQRRSIGYVFVACI
jgi:hypothetical protein